MIMYVSASASNGEGFSILTPSRYRNPVPVLPEKEIKGCDPRSKDCLRLGHQMHHSRMAVHFAVAAKRRDLAFASLALPSWLNWQAKTPENITHRPNKL